MSNSILFMSIINQFSLIFHTYLMMTRVMVFNNNTKLFLIILSYLLIKFNSPRLHNIVLLKQLSSINLGFNV